MRVVGAWSCWFGVGVDDPSQIAKRVLGFLRVRTTSPSGSITWLHVSISGTMKENVVEGGENKLDMLY